MHLMMTNKMTTRYNYDTKISFKDPRIGNITLYLPTRAASIVLILSSIAEGGKWEGGGSKRGPHPLNQQVK